MTYRLIIALLLTATLGTHPAFAGPKKYEEAKHGAGAQGDQPAEVDTSKAKDYWKHEGFWNMKKATGKKVAIAEFTVSYVINRDSKVGGNQLGLLTLANIAGAGKRSYEFEESMRVKLPDELYELFVDALKAQGYEVIPMDTVGGAKAMQDVKHGDSGVKKGGGYDNGWFEGGGAQKVRIYPVEGLPRIKDGMFDAGKNMNAIAAMMHEVGADTALRVRLCVGLFKGQATAEAGSNVFVLTGLDSYQTPGKETRYTVKTWGQVHAKKTLYFPEPVVDSKEFEAFKGDVYTVNSDKYRAAIKKLVSTYSAYAVAVMDK